MVLKTPNTKHTQTILNISQKFWSFLESCGGFEPVILSKISNKNCMKNEQNKCSIYAFYA